MGASYLGRWTPRLGWLVLVSLAATLLGAGLAGSAGAQSIPKGDGVGVQDPNTGRWTLRDTAGNLIPFLYGNPNDIPFMGDWDCDGIDTAGLFRPNDNAEGRAGKFYLRNTNTTGIADIEFFYGNPDDVPVVGDWDADGCDDVGVYRPSTTEFLLKLGLGSDNRGIGAADIAFRFGDPGDVPFAGDFDGNGQSGVGVRNPITGRVSAKNEPKAGPPDVQFFYGNPGDEPIAGDWDGNPTETIGVYRPAEARFYLKNSNTTSTANTVVTLGDPFWNGFPWSPSPDNQPPSATPQSVMTDEDTALPITLSGTDPDGDPLTFEVTQQPANGTLSGAPPNLTYTPDANFHGADGFFFTASDAEFTSAPALVSITVKPVNDQPQASDQPVTTPEDTPVAIVLQGDDEDGDDLTFTIVAGPSNGTLTGTPPNVTYTPNPDYNGPDSFTFNASDDDDDSETATVSITVTPVNDAPVANDDGPGVGFTTDEDSAFTTGNVLANDTDVDGDTLSVAVTGAGGTLGTVVDNGDGTYGYTPPASANALAVGESLADSWQYSASDGNGGFDAATVTVTVTGLNDPPTANPDSHATNNDTVLVVNGVLDNDTDPDTSDTLTVSQVQGSAAGVGNPTATTEGGTVTVQTDGSFTYDPTTSASLQALAAGATQDDTFTYQASDGNGGTSTTTVTITVTGVAGVIVVEKQTLPDGDPQLFDFTGDAAGPITDGGAIVVISLDPGSYSSTETVPAGWALTDITCDDGNSTGDTGTATATFNLEPGEVVTCVFTNTKDGSITIEKQTLPDGDPQAFAFAGDVGGTLGDGGTATQAVQPGTHTSTETVPAGWALTDVTCDDGNSSGDTGTATATFVVEPGEDVTCVFTNTKDGSITIEKQTLPDGDPQTFAFAGDVGGTLGDGGTATQAVQPGTHTSIETVPAGWALTDVTCDDGNSSGDTGTATATFVVEPGEDVTCVFTNTKDGSITIEKQTLPDGDPQTFAFAGDVAGTLGDGGTATSAVEPGTHTSIETVPAGWQLTDITCDDGNSTGDTGTGTATFQVEPGEDVTCVFTNTKLATIVVEKQTLPDGDPQMFDFTGDVAGTIGDGGALSEMVLPGTYTSTESGPPPAFFVSSITCDDGDSTGDTGTRTATFNVTPGEVVTCTFENTKFGAVTIVKDSIPDDPEDFAFTGDLGAFQLDDDADATLQNSIGFPTVVPGTYLVTEAAEAAFNVTDISCTDGNSTGDTPTRTATINVEPGEAVTCTFENTKVASLTIVKDSIPDDPQDFAYTGDLGAFFLDDDVDATLQNFIAFPANPPGTYTVTEGAVAGWDITDISCTDGNSTGDTGTGTLTANLEPGEVVTCTFENTKRGTIVVEKQTLPDGDPATFTIAGDAAGTIGDGQQIVVGSLVPGNYSASETVPAGWDLTDVSCDDGNSTGDTGTATASFVLDPGETVTCTFENTKRGSITIQKDTVGGDGTFGFTGDLGGFGLTTTAGTASTTFPDLEPGTFSVVEDDPAPVALSSITCDDGASATPSTGDTGTRTATIELDPGEDVTCVFTNSFNLPPDITSNGGGPTASITVDENQTAVTDVDATDDNDTEGGGGLTYSLTDDDGPGPNGSDNGAFTIDANSGALAFTSAPDFENPSDFDLGNDYEVQVTVTDSGPGPALTDHQNITVNVQDVNDAPTLDLDLDNSGGTSPDFSTTFTEGGGAVNLTDTDVDVADEDGDNIVSATITLTNPQDGAAEELDSSTGGACPGITVSGTGSHVVSLAGSATAAAYEQCLDDLTYENTSQDPTDLPDRTVTIVVNDGTVDSNTTTTTIDVVPVNDPPTLTAPGAFDSLGNVGIDVPQASGLVDTATITDPDWAGPFTVGTFDATSANGGTVSVNADGSFTYDPPPGFEGADTFTYTVCDGGSPLPSECSAADTVTLNVAEVIWFVDGDNGNDANDGTLTNPFATPTPLNMGGTAADDPGDVIFVYDATADYDVNDAGGFVLEDTQQLIGEGAVGAGGDTVADEAGLGTPPFSKALPAINGGAPTIGNSLGDVVTLADGNTITGVDLDPTSSGGIVGNGFTGLAVSDVSIDTSGGTDNNDGIDFTAPDGTITFTDVTIASLGTNSGTAVDIDGAAAGADIDFLGSSSITQTEGSLVDITNSASGATITFGASTTVAVTDPTSTAFNLVDNGGATFAFDGGLTALQTAGNTAAGLVISNAAGTSTVSIGGATSVVAVVGAPGIDASDATLTAVFGRVDSFLSPTVGVRLNDLAGSVSIGNTPPGSSISFATGTAFEVDGGTATIFFDGTIDNTTGFDVEVKNRPAGAGDVTFSNDIGAAGPTTGSGISVTGNAGGQIAFNDRVRLSTGANPAVTLTSNGGATVRFFGGLEIATTTGTGFQATGGGTVEVLPGAGTTSINVGAGAPHAVDLNGVQIGAGDMTWGTITAANCSAECIDVDATTNAGIFNGGTVDIDGTTGGFAGIAISGSSATFDFTAATIDSTGGAGIDLDGANGSVTFDFVDIDSTGGAGVEISGNTNPVLVDVGSIGATTPPTGDGVNVNGGGSTVTIDATIRQTGASNSVDVTNRSGGSVAFTGAIDDDAAGINLSSNAGSFTFSGGMTLDTGASIALNASSSGTLNVTGTNRIGSSSPLSTTAISIQGTALGGSGVTFQDVNVSAGAVGIDIDGGGSSGFFTITGVGTTAGSGGTIQNTTENGILIENTDNVTLNNVNLTNAADEAVGTCTGTVFTGCTASLELNTVENVSIDNMAMSGSGEHGVFGSTVTNLDISDSSFTNLGDATDENGIFVVNLLGTVGAGLDSVFDNVTVTNAGDNGIQVNNATATNAGNTSSPDKLTVQGSTINTSGVGGIQAITDTGGTGNLRLDVNLTNFSANASVGIATNANGGDVQTNITNNMILHGAGTQFRAVSGQGTSTGDLFFTVTGNTMTANNGGAGVGPAIIAYANNGSGTVNGTIGGAGGLMNSLTNNTPLGTPVAGVSIINNGAGSSRIVLNNNTISVIDGFGVIANTQGTNTGSGHFHLTGNAITVSGTDLANTAVSPVNSSSAGTQCLNISGNTLSTAPAGFFDVVLAKNNTTNVYQVQQTAVTTTGPWDFAANTEQVEIDINNAQTSSPGGTAVNPVSTPAAASFTSGTCTTPSSP